MRAGTRLTFGLVMLSLAAAGAAQRQGVFDRSRDIPAIAYSTGALDNAVEHVNRRLAEGRERLTSEAVSGYLRSTLAALQVPIESQVLVFSQTSLQSSRISPTNPRAIFFNDSAAVAWVRGSDVLEIAAHDARQGAIFYRLDQASAAPRFERDDTCLACHLAWETLGVPGLMVLSTFPMPDDPHAYAGGFASDHRSPIGLRWGGWYVTGRAPARHMGNVPTLLPPGTRVPDGQARPPSLPTVEGRFDTAGFLSSHSDAAALLVLEHQAAMANFITRLGWEARLVPPAPARVEEAAHSLVDYLLFVEEAPFPGAIRGSSAFSEVFSARGPRDAKGRSLYQLDLDRRLLRYRCSYMIYAPAFDALPELAKRAVYERMWAVLSGRLTAAPYDQFARQERAAIIEILAATKPDLPDYFTP
jgi:hypothetical protein